MKIEFPALESEPLIYFLLHSGVFVFALAAVFFLLGVWMGAAIWGRYKKQLQSLRAENSGQLQEIAVLKRKLTEQTMRATSAAPAPPTTLLTEVLPNVSEIFPERVKSERKPVMPVPVPAPFPAPVAAEIPSSAASPAAASAPIAAAPAAVPVPATDLPAPVTAELSVPAAPVTKPKTVTIRRPTIRVKIPKATAIAESAEITPSALVSVAESSPGGDGNTVAPFGFLLSEPEPEAEAAPAAAPAAISPLVAIINAPPNLAPPIAEPSPPAPPPAPVIPAVLPEIDPVLGPIYKIPPPNADDLTRIKGVASVLEKRLHDLGIYTWQQIATWEDSHIREFSSRLAFKDRIVREKWVEQARGLDAKRT